MERRPQARRQQTPASKPSATSTEGLRWVPISSPKIKLLIRKKIQFMFEVTLEQL